MGRNRIQHFVKRHGPLFFFGGAFLVLPYAIGAAIVLLLRAAP